MFKGFRRPDNRVGIRNKVLILPTVFCASEIARKVSELVKGTVYVNLQGGCAPIAEDEINYINLLSGLAANPNIYGTIVIGNTCENITAKRLEHLIKSKTNKPICSFEIREIGGSLRTIEAASLEAFRMRNEASRIRRERVPLSEIIIGTECGGSDFTSGLASNLLIGIISDRVVEIGGTTILSETGEMIGAENILLKRCKNQSVAHKLQSTILNFENNFIKIDQNLRKGNPTRGNKEGGISTLTEKSLGCLLKGGSSTINKVYGYGELIKPQSGLVVMDTPCNDIASVMAMIAGGAQIILFSTGRGTPLGSEIAPVLKITANQDTFNLMEDDIDYNCSDFLKGTKSLEDCEEGLMDMIVKVLNGENVKAERFGYNNMSTYNIYPMN